MYERENLVVSFIPISSFQMKVKYREVSKLPKAMYVVRLPIGISAQIVQF